MSGSRTRPADNDVRVYPVREDSDLLRAQVDARPGEWVLELGCGHGSAALAAARRGARVVATDLNPHALRSVRRAAALERLSVDVVCSDLGEGLGRFDLVLCNPPYLPTTEAARDPDPWVDLALNGGPDGCSVLERILGNIPVHLRQDGRAYVLTSSRQSSEHLNDLAEGFRRVHGPLRIARSLQLADETLWVWELRLRPPA